MWKDQAEGHTYQQAPPGYVYVFQGSSELPCLAGSPALGIPDTGNVHTEDLEPSYRKSQTSRDDRLSLNIQASKQESFLQLNPVKLPEMYVWTGTGWRGASGQSEKQAEGHSEVIRGALETWGKERASCTYVSW